MCTSDGSCVCRSSHTGDDCTNCTNLGYSGASCDTPLPCSLDENFRPGVYLGTHVILQLTFDDADNLIANTALDSSGKIAANAITIQNNVVSATDASGRKHATGFAVNNYPNTVSNCE